MSETYKPRTGGGMAEYLAGKRFVPAHGLGDEGAQWVAHQSAAARRKAEMEAVRDATQREQLLEDEHEAVGAFLQADNASKAAERMVNLTSTRERREAADNAGLVRWAALLTLATAHRVVKQYDKEHNSTPDHSGAAGLGFDQ